MSKKKKDEIQKSQEQKPGEQKDDEYTAKVKELEQAFFAIKFFPVAVKAQAKEEAKEKIKKYYRTEDETFRQLALYMIHDHLSQAAEFKTMYNFDYYKSRFPNSEPRQLRMNVYKAMFNYNFSLEGVIELIKLLGELDGDDAAKVLTYHFSFYSCIEVEAMHMLRNAVLEALGESTSPYALTMLLTYAKYTDNERLLQRIASALAKWDEKLDKLNILESEKRNLKEKLEQVLTLEFGDSHYG